MQLDRREEKGAGSLEDGMALKNAIMSPKDALIRSNDAAGDSHLERSFPWAWDGGYQTAPPRHSPWHGAIELRRIDQACDSLQQLLEGRHISEKEYQNRVRLVLRFAAAAGRKPPAAPDSPDGSSGRLHSYRSPRDRGASADDSSGGRHGGRGDCRGPFPWKRGRLWWCVAWPAAIAYRVLWAYPLALAGCASRAATACLPAIQRAGARGGGDGSDDDDDAGEAGPLLGRWREMQFEV
ncbi:unnamed protein product [Phaeothamnion confervicola]